MSGFFCILQINGAPVDPRNMARVAAVLRRRGPDAQNVWHDENVGVGHCLLATTTEALTERQPVHHRETGCVLAAAGGLDNRRELLKQLDLEERDPTPGDGEIVLKAYLKWASECVDHLIGDFAFALWDPRKQMVFAARDHSGMRPFYYHHTPGMVFAAASEPAALLALPQVPRIPSEERIADFLVSDLEGIDKTSTFFQGITRLPPAHRMFVSSRSVSIERYWRPEPRSILRMKCDDDYTEAFLERFDEAVRCRLRSDGRIGAMLSGGLDSGSVAATATRILAASEQRPLATFSAVGPDPGTCPETRAVHSVLAIGGFDPTTICFSDLESEMPELAELMHSVDEPFDYHMNLQRAVYTAAARRGIRVVLDGVSADMLLDGGSHLARLIRRGRWHTAYRTSKGLQRFWRPPSFWSLLRPSISLALVPEFIRAIRQGDLSHHRAQRSELLAPEFAERVALRERYRVKGGIKGLSQSFVEERCEILDSADLTVGRERYDRVASALGIEPRDPFLDRRLIDFCLALPGEQLLGDGWPKLILRRAMKGRLPEDVRWRFGKEHLGAAFTEAVAAMPRQTSEQQSSSERLLSIHKMIADPTCKLDAESGSVGANLAGLQLCVLQSWLGRMQGERE